jgi:hypothetical protein
VLLLRKALQRLFAGTPSHHPTPGLNPPPAPSCPNPSSSLLHPPRGPLSCFAPPPSLSLPAGVQKPRRGRRRRGDHNRRCPARCSRPPPPIPLISSGHQLRPLSRARPQRRDLVPILTFSLADLMRPAMPALLSEEAGPAAAVAATALAPASACGGCELLGQGRATSEDGGGSAPQATSWGCLSLSLTPKVPVY